MRGRGLGSWRRKRAVRGRGKKQQLAMQRTKADWELGLRVGAVWASFARPLACFSGRPFDLQK